MTGGVSSGPRIRQTDRPLCASLQRTVHRASVEDEVQPSPREPGEEFGGQEITLQAIAARAGENDVARNMSAAVRERMNVVQRCKIEFERGGAIDAATPAVARAGGPAWCHLA